MEVSQRKGSVELVSGTVPEERRGKIEEFGSARLMLGPYKVSNLQLTWEEGVQLNMRASATTFSELLTWWIEVVN